MQLVELKNQYETYLKENEFHGEPESLYEPMNYVMNLGGKRIRPILTVLGYKTSSSNTEYPWDLAHSMEVFHNFTLVHDDIMDEAPSRRGKPTVHIHYSMPTAILAGDNMLILAFNKLLKSNYKNKYEILELFTQTAQQICDGQQLDMDFELKENVSLEDYLKMIELKTAVLLGCCLKTGALAANANTNTQKALYDFGIFSGLAFQIMDDILDTFGNSQNTGKQSGGDILAAKKMILYHLAMHFGNSEQQNRLTELFDKKKTNPETRLSSTMDILNKLDIKSKAEEMMQQYFAKAESTLHSSGIEQVKYDELLMLNEFLKERNS
jgi:geranylgeranyl diphosphate synthase type II